MRRNLWLLAGVLVLQAGGWATAAPRPDLATAPPTLVVPREATICPPGQSCGPLPWALRDLPCQGILVGSTPAPSGSRLSRFSAREILDMNFTIRLQPGKPAPSAMVLKVYTPNGHLYQETTFPVAAPGQPAHERAVAGRHFATKEARVVTGRDRTVLAPPLPVAGTLISQSSLFGTWRVTAGSVTSNAVCSALFSLAP